MSHLEGIAADIGVAVVPVDVLPGGRWGEYRHRRREVRVLSGLAPVQCWSTLAHEIGHAYYGHRWTTARTELEADMWAARRLIDVAEWRYLTQVHADLLTVAHELQVLPRLAAVYAKHLARHPVGRGS